MWHCLALAFLLAPDGIYPPDWLYAKPEFKAAVRDNCLILEITGTEEPTSDICSIEFAAQRYWLHKLKDAPYLCDLALVPDEQYLSDGLYFNQHFSHTVYGWYYAAGAGRQKELNPLLDDLKWRRRIYSDTINAHNQYRRVNERRMCLDRVRTALGRADFYSYQFPLCVPLSVFRPIE
jgi:hypothetical protein